MKLCNLILIACIFLTSCNSVNYKEEDFRVALENGNLANESYVRSIKCVKAWMDHRDSISGLIPTNLTGKKDIWEPCNSAADNYVFMTLTAYLLDQDLYNGPMLDMLHAEKKLTSRIKSLPDVYRFSTRSFNTEKPDTTWIIFGTSEYIKDGLIPLTEYIGPSPWTDRMMEMLDDLSGYYSVLKDINQMDTYKAVSEEVNGSMLQTLSRVFWMTGNEKFLDWAVKIGDYYLVEDRDLSKVEYLRLRDHGCEIIGGLSELYVTLNFARPEKKKQYQERYYKVLDRVLEVGRNEDGLFYNAVNALTGEVVDSSVVDCWGYIFDAYYSVYLIDKKKEYRQAFLDGIKNLNEKYRNFAWEGKSHDGYADALESGINLYNREPVPALKEWIDSEMKVMWGMQQESGIIGGAHPDGNFERTAIMYALWKTQGVHCTPWRGDLKIGAEMKNGKLYIALSSENAWQGKLIFDYIRHKEILHLPIDYPRINQFPEWFTVSREKKYEFIDCNKKKKTQLSGLGLKNGIEVNTTGGEQCYIVEEERIK
jgi:hypothetical protein